MCFRYILKIWCIYDNYKCSCIYHRAHANSQGACCINVLQPVKTAALNVIPLFPLKNVFSICSRLTESAVSIHNLWAPLPHRTPTATSTTTHPLRTAQAPWWWSGILPAAAAVSEMLRISKTARWRQFRQHGRTGTSAECACVEVAPVRYIFLKMYTVIFFPQHVHYYWEIFKICEHILNVLTTQEAICPFLVTIRVNLPQSFAVVQTECSPRFIFFRQSSLAAGCW